MAQREPRLPDPCTLLSEEEVETLTGREVGQIDHDGGTETKDLRYCQWQQAYGNLGIALSRTAPEDFAFDKQRGQDVGELGDDAYWVDGILHVLVGPLRFSVQPRGSVDGDGLGEARRVADVLEPRVRELI